MIIKFVNGANNSKSGLKKKIEYICDPAKTNESLTGSVCCSKKYPYNDMISTKRLHHKASGKQYEHYVVGFAPEDRIDFDKALRVINDIALYFKDNQSIFTLHNNTEHLHAHVIMNSIDCNGKRFRQWKPQLNEFKVYVNQVCNNYGIKQVNGVLLRTPTENEAEYEILAEEIKKINLGGKTMNNNNYPSVRMVETTANVDNTNNYAGNTTIGYFNSGMSNYLPVQNAQPAYVLPSQCSTVTTNQLPEEPTKIHINIGDNINVAAPSAPECIQLLRAATAESQDSEINLDVNELFAACAALNTPVNINFGRTYNVVLTSKDNL